ncbi:MAG TPA: signal peptidase I, partial [Rhodopila sp.]
DYLGDGGLRIMRKLYLETLPNGVKHPILKESDDGPPNNTREYVVPAGNLFVMGDNRDNSADSRFEATGFGFLPTENLVGRAEILFFSIDAEHPWYEFWDWPFEIRWSRILKPLH